MQTNNIVGCEFSWNENAKFPAMSISICVLANTLNFSKQLAILTTVYCRVAVVLI